MANFSSISFTSNVRIDTSGKNGADGSSGSYHMGFLMDGQSGGGFFTGSGNDGSNGSRGYDGTDGNKGENAKNIDLQLTVKDEAVIASQTSGNTYYLKLGDRAATIFLRAVGGNGGNGGNGGKGEDGGKGGKGMNAIAPSTYAASGGSGGHGGDGGNGGKGGKGGKGGDIKVYVDPVDSDLLMLLKEPEVSGGRGGKGGQGGTGGSGGSGGAGGDGVTWTENQFSGYDSDGKARYDYVTKTLYSGSSGRSGSSGNYGSSGANGVDGVQGSFFMVMGNTSYQKLYDLQVSISKIVNLKLGNPEWINEPGEEVNLEVSVKNIGGMPTPPQVIDVSLQPAEWIDRKQSALILGSSQNLPINGSSTFSNPFIFRVKDEKFQLEEPLDRKEALAYEAVLRRVNKPFKSVAEQKDLLPVKYPVHLTSLTGKVAITFEETSALNLLVENISSISLGQNGKQNRRVYVIFKISKKADVKPSDVEIIRTEGDSQEGSTKITYEIDNIDPKSKKDLGVILRFKNSDLRLYSRVRIVAALYLDYFQYGKSDESVQARCIQKRVLHIQLCERYQPDPKADALLLTHAGVTADEMESWKKKLNALQLITSVFNVSYYNSCDFNKEIKGMKNTLSQDFSGKTVVVLNQTFRGNEREETIIGKMPPYELYHLAMEAQIKTYSLGEPIDYKAQCYPAQKDIDNANPQVLNGRFAIKSHLRSGFEKRVEKIAVNLRKQNPLHRHMIISNYEGKKINGVFKYQLGTVKVCPAPLANRTSVLNVHMTDRSLELIKSAENTYGIFKMLPFERKLTLLASLQEIHQPILEQAIISDLADEQAAFSQDRWTGKWNIRAIKGNLELMNILLTFNWKDIFQTNSAIKVPLKRIILKSRAFISLTPLKRDVFPSRRQRILAKATKEHIDKKFIEIFGIKELWKEDKTKYKKNLSTLPKKEMWNKVRNPYYTNFYQDNWDPRSVIIKQ